VVFAQSPTTGAGDYGVRLTRRRGLARLRWIMPSLTASYQARNKSTIAGVIRGGAIKLRLVELECVPLLLLFLFGRRLADESTVQPSATCLCPARQPGAAPGGVGRTTPGRAVDHLVLARRLRPAVDDALFDAPRRAAF